MYTNTGVSLASHLQEQHGEFAKAEEIYNQVLEENPANAIVMKRKIAILKAQKKTSELVLALNDYLRSFQTDQAAVRITIAIALDACPCGSCGLTVGCLCCVYAVAGAGRDVFIDGRVPLRRVLLRRAHSAQPDGRDFPQPPR